MSQQVETCCQAPGQPVNTSMAKFNYKLRVRGWLLLPDPGRIAITLLYDCTHELPATTINLAHIKQFDS